MDTKIGQMVAVGIATVLWVGLLLLSNSAKAAWVSMDVDKWNGPSGSYLCKDVRTCYTKVMMAEERGSTYYCNSVVNKRDGKVVWAKNYYK